MTGSKRKLNREKWQFHMDSWVRSDISQREYCLRNGVNYKTFLYWRKQFKNVSSNNKARVVQLKDKININSFIKSANGFSTMKISFAGFCVEFDPHIPLESLTGIIKALKSI